MSTINIHLEEILDTIKFKFIKFINNKMHILNKIIFLLTNQERNRAFILLIMILVMAILDTIGVASIMPFMTILSNPTIIENNDLLKFMYNKSSVFGVKNINDFTIALGVLVFFILVFSLAFKALTIYAQIRFAHMREHSIGKRLMQGYLSQPYSWLLNRNSADLSKTLFSEIHIVCTQALVPLINFIANTAVVISILILLIIVDPQVAFLIGSTLGLAYLIIYFIVRGYLKIIGKKRLEVNQTRFIAISEAFGAGKEVKLRGLEDVYVNKFSETTKDFAKYQASMTVLSRLPRFAIEAIAFGGMILVILYYLSKTNMFINTLPILALYAFAGYRILPALQLIYNSITQLRYVSPALDNLYNELNSNKVLQKNKYQDNLSFKKVICLKNINYQYPNTSHLSLKNITLDIYSNTKVAFVGTTGSGKSTLADIVLGLLEPNSGKLEVDGNAINQKNIRGWQNIIGYVPQQIYLADSSISENIAFGLDLQKINHNLVERVAKIANIHEFIKNQLPSGYKTIVGERGIRLSGGERQRLGIARALYHNPKVLVLDEATSALDNITEKTIMDSINNLENNITIVLIAHRLNTIKKCDKIFLLDKGELKDEGTYEELIKTTNLFRVGGLN